MTTPPCTKTVTLSPFKKHHLQLFKFDFFDMIVLIAAQCTLISGIDELCLSALRSLMNSLKWKCCRNPEPIHVCEQNLPFSLCRFSLKTFLQQTQPCMSSRITSKNRMRVFHDALCFLSITICNNSFLQLIYKYDLVPHCLSQYCLENGMR